MYNGFIINTDGEPCFSFLERAIIVTPNSENKPVAIQNDDDTATMKDTDQKKEETVVQFPHAVDRIGYHLHYIYFHVFKYKYLIAL